MSREKLLPQPVWNPPGEPSGSGGDRTEDNNNSEIPTAPETWISLPKAAEQLSEIVGKRIHESTFKEYLTSAVKKLGTDHYMDQARHREGGPPCPMFSPIVLTEAMAEFLRIPLAPEKWKTATGATKQLNETIRGRVAQSTFAPFLNDSADKLGKNEYLKRARLRGIGGGGPRPVYSPQLIADAIAEFQKIPIAPEEWLSLEAATRQLSNVIQKSVGPTTFQPILFDSARRVGEGHFLKRARALSGRIGTAIPYYSPKLIADAIAEFQKIPIAPEGWKTVGGALRQLKEVLMLAAAVNIDVNASTFLPYLNQSLKKLGANHYLEKARPERGGAVSPHYSPQLIAGAIAEFQKIPIAPEEWLSLHAATNKLRERIEKVSHISFEPYLKSAISQLAGDHYLKMARPRGKGGPSPFYSPHLVTYAIDQYGKIPIAPEKWMSLEGATKKLRESLDIRLHVNPKTFLPYLVESTGRMGDSYYVEKARRLHGVGKPTAYYSSELVTAAIEIYKEKNRIYSKAERQTILTTLDETHLDRQTPEGRAYQEMVFALGPEAARDLLYAMRPQLKTVPVEDLDGHLAPYLGEYRPPQPFPLGPIIDRIVPLLEHVPLQALLLASIKRECQRAYFQVRKASDPPDAAPNRAYLEDLRSHITQSSPAIEAVLKQAEDYFLNEIMGSISPPDRVLPNLTAGRPFPDIYQRINMSEIRSHQHFLIADEMGVGKSASAILAKESMGMKCALIVAPAAVCSTWEGYLSDRVRDDGKQVGYFKPGSAPRSLAIGSPKDLQRLRTETFEYVVISREKLTNYYMSALKALNFDMLVVDEVHEHKRGERGVYSKNLLELTSRIDSPEKRLVLLSGTPVPNKVQDVAMLIKLLHPEMRDQPIGSLSRSILTSDLLASRANLLPLMQMKSLSDHVEMPELRIEKVDVALSPQEEEQYRFLLETDDLEPQVKMPLLRKFLLNPASVVDVPTIESAKIQALKTEIADALKTKNKIMVFVNDFVENILRGGGSILDQLDLPPDIGVHIIHGNDKKEGRKREQTREQFRADNRPSILFLSGQTDSLGVDYSHADHAIFYNEPWTYAEFQQQVARIHRPQDLLKRTSLTCRVLVAKGTIEEGIYEYIRFKHEAIQRLMRGVPLTREQHDALQLDIEGAGPDDIEVNPELPLYYRSRFTQIMNMFGHTKERGQTQFLAALRDDGANYAAIYEMFGGRSYQDNAARVCGNLIRSMAAEQNRTAPDILDLGSGPAMLFRRSPGDAEDRRNHIVSLDLIRAHFEGKKLGMTVVGGMADIPFPEEKHFDYVNMSFSVQDTTFDPDNGEYERIHAFAEASRMLRINGRLLVNMMYTADFRDEKVLASALEKFGFRAVPKYTGEITSGVTYKSRVMVFEKVADVQEQADAIIATFSSGELNGFRFLSKTRQEKHTRARGRLSQRDRIISSFELNGQQFTIEFNSDDREIRAAEQRIMDEVEAMKDSAEGRKIVNIPRDTLMERGYSRLKSGKLFKIVPGDGQITLT